MDHNIAKDRVASAAQKISERRHVLVGGLYERTFGAAGQPLGGYRRQVPERTVLHELVAGHAQTLLAELRDADPDDERE